jgi:AcrR family transcriptional regulator
VPSGGGRGDDGRLRQRILAAALECIGRYGLSKTTVEDVARQAGSSRATVYRYFPGGRDELIREVISWEAGNFFAAVGEAVAGATGLAQVLEDGLVFAHRAVLDHQVLQKVLEAEPELLLPQLTVEATRILNYIRAFLLDPVRRAPLRPGLGPEEAADLLARLALSYIGSPGRWDLTDRSQVRTLVAAEMIAAVCAAG